MNTNETNNNSETPEASGDISSKLNVPNTIIKPAVAKMTKLAVASEGENVVLTIGNSQIRFHYETALKLSQWLRIRAKEAKRKAGDNSRHWSAIGNIEGLKG